jgi:tritrans,polycis-undecaprenyl-diphosphate synthase [geranylgeranyl-diphosphate specific]
VAKRQEKSGPLGRRIDRVGARVVESERVASTAYRLMTSRPGTALRSRLERAQCARILQEVRKHPVPRHVAIVMDGNRRAARAAGEDPTTGHMWGRKKLEQVLDWCRELGIKVLTVYAFSTENFQRTPEEVETLMTLFEENFRAIVTDERVKKHGVRVRAIGHLELLPEHVREAIREAEEATKGNDRYMLNLAVAYGGREEIVNAVRELAEKVKNGEMDSAGITHETVSKHLYTNGLPDPDLILRTSGEERISNFLLWQMAYSELYFADVYWPELRKKDFLRAIESYQKRNRRMGK